MADLDLDELRRVAEAATPGEWEVEQPGVIQSATPWADVIGMERRGRAYMEYEALVLSDADAAHIAAMDPPTTLALLAEVVALREQVARVRALAVPVPGVVFARDIFAAFDAAGDPT